MNFSSKYTLPVAALVITVLATGHVALRLNGQLNFFQMYTTPNFEATSRLVTSSSVASSSVAFSSVASSSVSSSSVSSSSSSVSMPYCGDGTIDPGEECEDGNSNDNDACKNDCTRSQCLTDADCPTNSCQSFSCVSFQCVAIELCDDNDDCTIDSCNSATGDCSYAPAEETTECLCKFPPPTGLQEYCGIGVPAPFSTSCNGGTNYDSCNSKYPELGYVCCNPQACSTASNSMAICTLYPNNGPPPPNNGSPPVCGNNIEETGEECDDANTTSGDGCSSTCLIEGSISAQCVHIALGFNCAGAASNTQSVIDSCVNNARTLCLTHPSGIFNDFAGIYNYTGFFPLCIAEQIVGYTCNC